MIYGGIAICINQLNQPIAKDLREVEIKLNLFLLDVANPLNMLQTVVNIT